MRIGIDARLWNETGVGRYIRALVANLSTLDRSNQYVLFVRRSEYLSLKLSLGWQKRLADIRWHTLREQLEMPKIYKQAELDLLHVPYFSVPILTSHPLVVTVHDLTISRFATGRATTLPQPLYFLKRLGYELVLRTSLSKATKIITVSQSVKQEIIHDLAITPDKITVTYESGELEETQRVDKKMLPQPYILYVGNAHPHKNVERLIEAFVTVRRSVPNLALVLIGKNDYFYARLRHITESRNLADGLIFLNEVSNRELKRWYAYAQMFVFPSLSEGFGIPGLEAMSVGCPVIASDIPVFREVYGEAAYFCNQRDPSSLSEAMTHMLQNKILRQRLVSQGLVQVKKYSWKKMTQETLVLYESCVRV